MKRITCQTFEEFEAQVRDIIVNVKIEEINKLIRSMEERVKEVVKKERRTH